MLPLFVTAAVVCNRVADEIKAACSTGIKDTLDFHITRFCAVCECHLDIAGSIHRDIMEIRYIQAGSDELRDIDTCTITEDDTCGINDEDTHACCV